MRATGYFSILVLAGGLQAAEFRAGVASVKITPRTAIWMSGYASRTKPSQGVVQDLWAKALAFDDGKGKAVIVTTDLIGLPRAITDVAGARIVKEYGVDRSRVLFNSAHTHTGPVVRPNLATMYALPPEQDQILQAYSLEVTDNLVSVVGAALADLAPARVSVGHGKIGFATNRRQVTPKGIKLGVNPEGPVDHDVPVIKVTSPDGKLRAVLFAYACHNTTLTGEFYQISGDYAGFAQSEVERLNPGATALFMQLCGGDQNPNPRGTLEIAKEHGAALGAEVNRVLREQLSPVRGPIRAAYKITALEFAPHTREQFEKELTGANVNARRRAQEMLTAYNQGAPVRRTPYPVQALRFNKDLTLIGLGGEVVVDYALRAKREYAGKETVIVAGYCNDVMCYIPSKRMLSQGGYEVVDSMVFYGQPGPFNDEVEEFVFDAVHDVMKRVGRAHK